MVATRHALIVVMLLPVAARAQAPVSGERVLAAKLAAAEQQPPIDRGDWGLILPPEAQALSCGVPCLSGNVQALHPYYDVFLNCTNGAFTARTGASHSVTAAAGRLVPRRDSCAST